MLRHWAIERISEGLIARIRHGLQAVLDETTTSSRLLKEQLTVELGKIERQEENLLDLAADGELPTGKVRTRLTRLQVQRHQIQERLRQSDDRMAEGIEVLEMQLDLFKRRRSYTDNCRTTAAGCSTRPCLRGCSWTRTATN